jgi:hypothetical protein
MEGTKRGNERSKTVRGKKSPLLGTIKLLSLSLSLSLSLALARSLVSVSLVCLPSNIFSLLAGSPGRPLASRVPLICGSRSRATIKS